MSTFILLTVTGLGLAALYFLVASGLSLIFGLMDILNFAHGGIVTLGGYAAWTVADHLGGNLGLIVALPVAILTGALVAAAIELLVIRPLYKLLIFAFVVVVLGRLGSITGTALAAIAVGLVQQFANYESANLGNESVVILLAAVLLMRRRELQGRPA